MLKSSREFIEKGMASHNGGVVRFAAQLLMRRNAELLAAMMFDEQGNKVASTTQELARRMLSAETTNKYDRAVVLSGLNVLLEIHELQERLGRNG